MDKQIEDMATTCSSCHKIRINPPLAPFDLWEFLLEPWHRMHINFAGPLEDKMFPVAVDAHSKWSEAAIMRAATTERTIEKIAFYLLRN